jgi:hypothetical protein
MVVSNAFVRQYFPNEEPIGRRIVFDGNDKTAREIVGVVADVRRNGLDVNVQPEMYVSHVQKPERRLNVVIRTEAEDALQLAQAARAEVKAFDPNRAAAVQYVAAWDICGCGAGAGGGGVVWSDELFG